MENQFLEMNHHLRRASGKRRCRTKRNPAGGRLGRDVGFAQSFSSDWAQPFSASDRVLVILIENGGVDLGIPELVDALLSAVPGASAIPGEYRQKLIDFIREKIKGFTDNLIETAELTLNRYSAAKPDLFSDVVVLRDGTASYADLKST